MAEIRPFRGLHYNLSLLGDLSRVICPPYDIISSQLQQELYARDEHNFVRLELGRELPQDSAGDDRYSRAGETLAKWLDEGVIEADETPAIYLHDHYFQLHERKHRRRGIIVRARLEEWEAMVVRPHEGTLPGARRDRLDLLGALQANTSPVLSMFEDRERRIAAVLDHEASRQPMMHAGDFDGERHDVWAITDGGAIGKIVGGLAEQPLYIADGHHRYTSSLTYRRQRRDFSIESSDSAWSGEEACNFVMMTLVDMADPGLVVLAPHRLVRGVSRTLLDGLAEKLAVFFDLEELPRETPDLWRQVDERLGESDGVRLACYGVTGENVLLLRLRDPAAAAPMMPTFHTRLFQSLDVSVTDHVILDKLLEVDPASDEQTVAYCQDRQEAVDRVRDGEYQVTFFLRPVAPSLIKAIADDGDRMPRKSSYFFPKTPVGLVFNRLV
ncbi:MAG: DUF1015 domain-containing protein [Dehalococcoidales bacterium]